MMVKKETKNFSWDNAKKMMAKVDVFKQSLEQYDKENILRKSWLEWSRSFRRTRTSTTKR